MARPIDIAIAGLQANGEIMDNGETRYRLVHPDGTAYIRTEAGRNGAWQNAHHHQGARETYAVETGWMALASEPDNEGRFGSVEVFFPGDTVTTKPHYNHNVYLPERAVIHTIRHGIDPGCGNPDKGGADWYPASEEFDAWTKSLTVEDIARLANVTLPE